MFIFFSQITFGVIFGAVAASIGGVPTLSLVVRGTSFVKFFIWHHQRLVPLASEAFLFKRRKKLGSWRLAAGGELLQEVLGHNDRQLATSQYRSQNVEKLVDSETWKESGAANTIR